jgi:hypothetical protein
MKADPETEAAVLESLRQQSALYNSQNVERLRELFHPEIAASARAPMRRFHRGKSFAGASATFPRSRIPMTIGTGRASGAMAI